MFFETYLRIYFDKLFMRTTEWLCTISLCCCVVCVEHSENDLIAQDGIGRFAIAEVGGHRFVGRKIRRYASYRTLMYFFLLITLFQYSERFQ